MSSTNFRSKLIFASCVVGTYNILRGMWVSFLHGRGPILLFLKKYSMILVYTFCFFSTLIISVGIFTLGGAF